MRIPLLLVVFLISISCRKAKDEDELVRYRDGRQLLTMNSIDQKGEQLIAPRILKICRDSILVGDELFVKIFLETKDLKLVEAFVDCDSIASSEVDTATYKVSGCSTALLVQNDTIFIGFRPINPGFYKFSEITVLTRDKEKIFRTFKYSFNYTVVARPQ